MGRPYGHVLVASCRGENWGGSRSDTPIVEESFLNCMRRYNATRLSLCIKATSGNNLTGALIPTWGRMGSRGGWPSLWAGGLVLFRTTAYPGEPGLPYPNQGRGVFPVPGPTWPRDSENERPQDVSLRLTPLKRGRPLKVIPAAARTAAEESNHNHT